MSHTKTPNHELPVGVFILTDHLQAIATKTLCTLGLDQFISLLYADNGFFVGRKEQAGDDSPLLQHLLPVLDGENLPMGVNLDDLNFTKETLISFYYELCGLALQEFLVTATHLALFNPAFVAKLKEQASRAKNELGDDDFLDCLENNNSHLFAEYLGFSSRDIFGYDVPSLDNNKGWEFMPPVDIIQSKFMGCCRELV